MVIETDKKLNWLIEPRRILWYWGAIGILCIYPTLSFIAFYDLPLVPESGLEVVDKLKYALTPDRKI
jgi:hypothetical protein